MKLRADRMEGRAIAHVSTVHSRLDTRVAVKELVSATRFDAGSVLMVADGQGDSRHNGVRIVDLGRLRDAERWRRMLLGWTRVFRAVKEMQPKIVHFHDPELLPVAFVLRCMGYALIYDVHEDVPRQIMENHSIPSWIRVPMSWAAEGFEWCAGRILNAVVAATPTIANRFPPQKTTLVCNFPILDELGPASSVPYGDRPNHFVYVGSITRIRGAEEMVSAIGIANSSRRATLLLAGRFGPPSLQGDCQAAAGWQHVDFVGWATRDKVISLLSQSRAGLVLLHPTEFYPDAYPVKLFEYMAAGIPVIASDFPLWRTIVSDTQSGILVDPLDPDAIARAMIWILDNPAEAHRMGMRGKKVVAERFNWAGEEKKLTDLYTALTNR